MIEVFTRDQRLTGKAAKQALAAMEKDLSDKARGAAILASAREQADAILAAAREEVAALQMQAQQDAETTRQAVERERAVMQAEMRKDMQAQLAGELSSVAAQLATIMQMALEKLVGDIGAADMVRGAVLTIMRNDPQITAIRLRVAPSEVKGLADLPIEIVQDAGLAASDALLETTQGIVDLGKGAQLAALGAIVRQPASGTGLERGAA